jgi:hypothetical protein
MFFCSPFLFTQVDTASSQRRKEMFARSPFSWDSSAVYKPFAIYDGRQWLLWYNGRKNAVEQIGMAVHKGKDLGF